MNTDDKVRWERMHEMKNPICFICPRICVYPCSSVVPAALLLLGEGGVFLCDDVGHGVGGAFEWDHRRCGDRAALQLELAFFQAATSDDDAQGDADQVGVLKFHARPLI